MTNEQEKCVDDLICYGLLSDGERDALVTFVNEWRKLQVEVEKWKAVNRARFFSGITATWPGGMTETTWHCALCGADNKLPGSTWALLATSTFPHEFDCPLREEK